jgi:hypothetical protein
LTNILGRALGARDGQQCQWRQNIPNGHLREINRLIGVLKQTGVLAEGQIPTSAPEVFTQAEIPHGNHHGHDAPGKQPQDPPRLILVGRQEGSQSLDAVVSHHRISSERKTQQGNDGFHARRI